MLFHFRKQLKSPVTMMGVLGYVAFTFALLSGKVPAEYMAMLQLATIPIFSGSRLPQIWSNFSSGSTGQLSVITFFLNFAGSCARVFTTMQETSDPTLLVGFASGAVLNGILLAQIFWYWSSDKKQKKKQEHKTE